MIEIIKAEEQHVTAIGKLWWELMIFHQNIDHIFTPREGSILGFEENQVRRLMKSQDGLVLVAVDSGKVVGYSLSEIREPSPTYQREKYGNIVEMFVTLSHRHKGIGEKMVIEIIRWFRSRNITRVELQTAAQNVVANLFWQKQGFTIFRHTLYKEI